MSLVVLKLSQGPIHGASLGVVEGRGIVMRISVEQLVHVPAVANKIMFKFVFTFAVKRNANKYD